MTTESFSNRRRRLLLRYPTIPCNDCKYCMPCPYGLDIPAILLHYNKCVNEGNVATSSQDDKLPPGAAGVSGGLLTVRCPRLRQAEPLHRL